MNRTKSLLPVDEINSLLGYLDANLGKNTPGSLTVEDTIDSLLELLILSYTLGCDSANYDLDTSIEPNTDKLSASVNKVIADKTWEQRVNDYFFSEDYESIKRVVETETHRVYNEGQYDTAVASGVDAKKTWMTMLDDKVRDTHDLLEGVTVGIDEKFYTIDGDSALSPGGFTSAENNINCRCELKLSK